MQRVCACAGLLHWTSLTHSWGTVRRRGRKECTGQGWFMNTWAEGTWSLHMVNFGQWWHWAQDPYQLHYGSRGRREIGGDSALDWEILKTDCYWVGESIPYLCYLEELTKLSLKGLWVRMLDWIGYNVWWDTWGLVWGWRGRDGGRGLKLIENCAMKLKA